MNDTKTKKQIVDKIKESNNVLVALSASPTVDELSAALGITLAINKIDKHATAVFSGEIPRAIEFLEPQKTFENTVLSLQDFIIALDKEKADHLRYKVEGDMVKIFITPYRTTIDERDLEFSQGDYNVEFVLAIGVKEESDLDAALNSHGQILQDATVASVSLDETSKLGTLNWSDKNASSYCELMASLAKDLSEKSLLDEQIATALLTGIVAATDRFSNAKTSSRVMTVAADLMAAGANQQLIAVQLEQAHEISGDDDDDTPAEDEPKEAAEPQPKPEAEPEKPADSKGELSISHQYTGDVDEVAEQVAKDRQDAAAQAAEDELSKRLNLEPKEAPKEVDYEETPLSGAVASDKWRSPTEPALGGTLNATTEEAADAKRREESSTRNRTILSHDSSPYVTGQPSYQAPISAAVGAANDEPEVRDIFADSPATPASQVASAPTSTLGSLPPLPTVQAPAVQPLSAPASAPSLAEIDAANRAPSQQEALNDVHAALNTQAAPASPAADVPLPSLPPLPPMPDFSTLPPLPGQPPATPPSTGVAAEPLGNSLPPANVPPPTKQDPGQFQIPGQ